MIRKALIIMLSLVMFSPLITANCQNYIPNSLTMDIYSDGSVDVEYKIEPDPIMVRVNVSLPGQYYSDLIAVDEDGIILDWDPVEGGIEVDSIGAEELSISYSSVSLTNKTGSMWTVSVDSEVSTNYILPLDSVLVGLSSTPSSISIMDNRASITMLPGISKISYSLGATGSREHSIILLLQAHGIIEEAKKLEINTLSYEEIYLQATKAYDSESYTQSERFSHQIIEQMTEIIESATKANDQIVLAQELLLQKADTVGSETQELAQERLDAAINEYESGQYLSAYTCAGEAIQLLEEVPPKRSQNILLGLGLFGIIGVIGFKYYSQRNKPDVLNQDTPLVDLDRVFKYKDHLRTDEKAVLRFIGESGGAFITDVREHFDIPKSSAWRMMRRLEEEEVITVSMVGRETYLQLRDPDV